MENLLTLTIPRPDKPPAESNGPMDRFRRAVNWGSSLYDWSAISFDQFTSAICASNYKQLTNPVKMTSKYEIYISVMGITAETMGVDHYEITPEKSFTNDLGID